MTLRTTEPKLSWLLLERYVLGELSDSERARVEARLRESETDRACLASILEDVSELPALPTPSLLPVHNGRKWRNKQAWGLTLAAAAACMLALLNLPATQSEQKLARSRGRTKGGEFVLQVVSARGTVNPERFAQGEPLKVLVTCPQGLREELGLVIFQGTARFEPLPAMRLACGNLVPWPGAFSLDGKEPVTLCVATRARTRGARRAQDLGPDAVCTDLLPE